MKKAVILLSGGLDSTTCLAIAKEQGFTCHALSILYGQRNHPELEAARKIAAHFAVQEHRFVTIDMGQFGGSALTDKTLEVPTTEHAPEEIPITYVPARNTVFLAVALSYAESIGAYDLFIGANAIDYGNYPDCRPEYLRAFQDLAQLATKAGAEGNKYTIHAPLLQLSKAEIIKTGIRLHVDYSASVSCYHPDAHGFACGQCLSCTLRRQGFAAAGTEDPTKYQ